MKKLIAGNWKMNLSAAKAEEFALKLNGMDLNGVDVVLCAPAIFLERLKNACGGDLCSNDKSSSKAKIGAQNVSWAEKGAFTGEISASMLAEMNVEYAIIGHSERRAMFGETDLTVNKRLKNALKSGLIPIVCVGETESERENNLTEAVLKRQITEGLKDVTAQEIKTVVIAYEPVWAIGTSKSATPAQADEAIGFIRSLIKAAFNENVRILYGGSMNGGNAEALLSQKNIDGGLIGGASLDVDEFYKIIKAAQGK